MTDQAAYHSRAEVREFVERELLRAGGGRANAMTLDALRMVWAAERGGEVSGRQLRCAIAELVRQDGLPIIGDSGCGYYVAATPEELRIGYAELRRRALAMLYRGMRLLDKGRSRLGHQQTLDLRLDQRSAKAAIAVLGLQEED